MSVENTERAPAALATATAQQPMGPDPTTTTPSPATSPDRVVCTALPKGSWIAATSTEIPGSMGYTLVSGMATRVPLGPGAAWGLGTAVIVPVISPPRGRLYGRPGGKSTRAILRGLRKALLSAALTCVATLASPQVARFGVRSDLVVLSAT